MIVYVVYECYYNGESSWDTIVRAFKDKTEAELYALDLQEKQGKGDIRSYYMEELEIH